MPARPVYYVSPSQVKCSKSVSKRHRDYPATVSSARTLRQLEAYDVLIANIDRHYGNISLLLDNDDWALAPPTASYPSSTQPTQVKLQ